MFARLARFAIRRRVTILTTTLIGLIVAGAFGGSVASRLSNGGFDDPNSENTRAYNALNDSFHRGPPNLVLLVTAPAGVDTSATRTAGLALTHRLALEPGVTEVVSYWTAPQASPFANRDGHRALVLGRINGDVDKIRLIAAKLSPKYTAHDPAFTVEVGGFAEVFRQVSSRIQSDLAKAEAIAIPITLLALVVVFGGLVAAALPLAIGGMAILGTLAMLRLLTMATDVSIFSLNMATALGLGLGIDYALFIVSRYREEIRHGADAESALVTTMETAGRTIVFSALTVALSMSALLVFPLFFLRSFAYAGIAVVLIAMVGALVVLPALLAVLGRRVDSLVLFRRPAKPEGTGAWHHIAMTVMRRPIPIGSVAILLLLGLGLPFLSVQFGLPDDRTLPASASSHRVTDVIRAEFPSRESATLTVVGLGVADPARSTGVRTALDSYATKLSSVPGVVRVDAWTGRYADGVRVAPPGPALAGNATPAGITMTVVPGIETYSTAGEQLVRELRAVPAPFEVGITGAGAQLVDVEKSLFSRMPLALAIIALTTLILLFLLTGSIVVPLKAIVLNLLSLSAMFGAMVWIFQDGHLAGLLGGFTVTHTLDTTTPMLMFCVAFGLSMDYEVFLISRIKEEYDRTGDNTASVASGLEKTGGIVTSAALLFAIVNISFTSSGITFIKLFGLGLTVAVVMDATVVRGMLVPSFMRLMGDRNWWAPAWMKALHRRIGLSETGPGQQRELVSADQTA